MEGGAQPTDTEMAEAGGQPPPSAAAPPSQGPENIQETLSHGGRFIQYNMFGNVFEVTSKYKPPIMPIGKGAYGIVCSALNSETGEQVAIKKIANAFDNKIDAKRTLREIKLLRHLDHENIVAIRDIIPPPEQISSLRDEFSNEVELLAKIEHNNLVRLLGYTDKGNERIIITEYVPNGTLREHLDGLCGKILDFSQRVEIAIDVAHALTYLHLYAEKTIIHRDVKSSNILLTESYRAKVSDFGFARSGLSDTDQTHISTKVKGTAGYLDPEYLRTYQLTPKSDVFSFGILLIEIISGRRPVDLKRNADERITVRWAFKKHSEGNVKDILDPLLEENVDDEIIGMMLDLAFDCAAPTRSSRPAMKEVGEQLWEIRKRYGKTLRGMSGSLHQ